MSMPKISNVFGLRTLGNPKNHQISHYWYVWGQPRSVASDDLWKVIMQCQRSHVVMCWPKSCIMSPSSQWQQVPWLKTWFPWKVGRRMFSLWRHSSVTWPDPVNFFWQKVAQRMLHKPCRISARSAQRFGGHFRKLRGLHPPPPPLAGFKIADFHQNGFSWIFFFWTKKAMEENNSNATVFLWSKHIRTCACGP